MIRKMLLQRPEYLKFEAQLDSQKPKKKMRKNWRLILIHNLFKL